jgi:hypothetical protein
MKKKQPELLAQVLKRKSITKDSLANPEYQNLII